MQDMSGGAQGRRRWFMAKSRHAQLRMVFIAGGLAVGVCAVGFADLADYASTGFAWIVAQSEFLPLVITPLGLVVASAAASRWFPGSQGSGIPQVIAARALTDEAERHRLVSLRVAVGKVMLTALGLLCGGSIGREGPTVQVGASLMYFAGHLSPRRQRGLVLAGAAAGVAAAFNTPLAGIVFGIEEMSRSFETRTSGLVIGTVICGGLVSLVMLGDYNYFGMSSIALHGASVWLAVPVCGVAGGLAGGLFSRLVVAAGGAWPGWFGRHLKPRPVLFAAICGLGVAICGLLSHGTVYGTGYSQVLHLLDGRSPPPEQFGGLKWLATLLSAICGIPGGIFSPSLAVGAGLGRNLHDIYAAAPLAAMVVLGMAGYFAGVVQAPITAFVIITEMTGDHALVVPVMLTALIGHSVSRLICREGIYHALAHRFLHAHQQRQTEQTG
jgi:H+/Cl- antiporter ClcA